MIEELTKKEKIKKEREYVLQAKSRNIRCARCGNEPNEFNPLTLDHIISDDLLQQFGLDPRIMYDEDNNQILCRRCNLQKGHKLDFSNPKTIVVLRKYLDLISSPPEDKLNYILPNKIKA